MVGGDLDLPVIRGLFDQGERFVRAVTAMLDAGEVRLLVGGVEASRWRWKEWLVSADDLTRSTGARLTITESGVRRIG